MEPAGAHRRIWLCADDYAMAPGIDRAIRDLVIRGRLNATSVMTASPNFSRAGADALAALNSGGHRVAIGLHVTLTGPFHPLTRGFRPLRRGAFAPIAIAGRDAMMRRYDEDGIAAEIAAQLEAFIHAFGRRPDFVDGHQHVHLFPQLREAFLKVVAEHAPRAWVRQCGRVAGQSSAARDPKGWVIDRLSGKFRALALQAGLRTNPAFAGTYAFRPEADFARLFPTFLDNLPDGGLVMCHPGFVDDALRRLDPLTDLREREHAYLAGEEFPRALAAHGMSLA
jgi:predicted glycoside hydrolase/deacetylase ChbG (UPF0249 family)